MVTLKNNFGVEPDKDSAVMNVSEGSGNETKSNASGHPKAILICRKNSHPFQARTLILNTPAKIGRSVARARPSSYNGIFDCKVLSRNHAVIWYEYESGKFMIQDTKSSNGTFVNNQRLSKGGETSVPREFFSKDVVQFGVDVLENQRKGNEDSDNSDESNHIVTHGCIVASVRLFHPNGKENKSGQTYHTSHTMAPAQMAPNQEKMCKLELIIYEAQQREGRLHDKLEELQLIIGKLEVACQETLTNRFEETRLLSKIANLEKQIKVMSRVMSGAGGKASEKIEGEIQQLLMDIEKVQTVAREIQERQHRKLLESEQKLIEAQRVASNLELEVITLREQAALTELQIQEMESKCTDYCETIDLLTSNFHAQIELTQKLGGRLASERDTKAKFPEQNVEKYKLITEEEDEGVKKDKENQEVVLERCKNYDEIDKVDEKDFINEDDKTEWLTKKFDNLADAMCNGLEHISNCIGQLEGTLVDVERSKKKLEKLFVRSHVLSLELDSAKMPAEKIEKTDNEYEGELFKPVNLSTQVSNEKITELEIELEENEDLLNQERVKQRESEGKYTKLRCELDATIKRCEKLIVESSNLRVLLKKHLKCVEENTTLYIQKIGKLESDIEELENGQERKLLEILGNMSRNVEAKETQTLALTLVTSSTNTDSSTEHQYGGGEEIVKCVNIKTDEPLVQQKTISNSSESQPKNSTFSSLGKAEHWTSEAFQMCVNDQEKLNELYDKNKSENLGVWEKIQAIQNVLSNHLTIDESLPLDRIIEVKNLINLLAEDWVHFLLREQKISKNLQELANKSQIQNEKTPIGISMNFRTILLFCVTALTAYIIYIIFL